MAYNIHIENSYAVSKHHFQAVIESRREWDELVVRTSRSMFSLKMEWTCHNFLYNLGIARERTKDVDLNAPMKWYVQGAYIVGGILTWLFIK